MLIGMAMTLYGSVAFLEARLLTWQRQSDKTIVQQ
jgi:hypothetical protein